MNLTRNGSATSIVATLCAAAVSLIAMLIEYAFGHTSEDVLFAIILLFLSLLLSMILLCHEAQFPLAGALLWSTHYTLSLVHAEAHHVDGHTDAHTCQSLASVFIVLLCCAMVFVLIYLGRRKKRQKHANNYVLSTVVVASAVLAPVYIFHSECDNMLHGAFVRLVLFYTFMFIFQIGMIAQNTPVDKDIAQQIGYASGISTPRASSIRKRRRQTAVALSALLFILYIPWWAVLVLTLLCTLCITTVVYTRGAAGLSKAFDDDDNDRSSGN